ncbi:zinc-dependent peptidase lipoprotein, M16 family [Citrifermentans bemidjiense Bem]|uniref:Zinc-dependent peptidase lipoprotein, M16 family n=1 Tax=Citrifermentans bemidjiense (strain ATCC BAA-1014 / DSM 16622 / JCM 12645 / Bem) TaxID=404380 RepID=B5EDX5_CITBB|nr:pitrilysin family protein [Citrifermentans bemidjiense]ACH37713.1 zinc-dependent peptidase lipoprotein, M16 family [Citrifermentans bemidjiense Bem]
MISFGNSLFNKKSQARLTLFGILLAFTAGCSTMQGSAAKPDAPQAQQLAQPRNMSFPPLNFKLPKSDRVQLKNGMIVYLLQDRELPIVNLTSYLNAGSIYEPEEKVGLAALTGAVLRSGGTLKTPPEQLDRELEFMASSIESSINSDHAGVSFSTLSVNLDKTLALFAEILKEPAFDPARVEIAKSHAFEGIRRQNDDPKEIAGRELARAIYADHPLGRIPTIATVKAVTREDMVEFQKRYFYPANMILAVSGDFDREKLLQSLEKLFADWPNRNAPFPPVPKPNEELTPAVLHVQKDVNQSVIRMGHLGIDKNNPDLYAIKVMDYILGGGFTSRLTQEIRSNQGLAYNVDSYFEVGRRFKGSFVAETETKSESTVKAITLLNAIITGMTQAEVSDEELKLAKDSIINSFIFGFDRSSTVVNQQARLEFYGYPEGYLEHYRDNIARVTRADVLRVARQYLRPDAMKLVVVGNEKKFDQPLSLFGKVQEIKLNNNK